MENNRNHINGHTYIHVFVCTYNVGVYFNREIPGLPLKRLFDWSISRNQVGLPKY